MKNHITKAIALVMVVLMLIGTVPVSALPVLALDSSSEAQNDSSTNIFDSVVLGKETVNQSTSYAAGVTADPHGEVVVDNSYSPYEPYSTEDENHPFLPGGPAWIDLSRVYYGAPATQNYPITKWSANTSVYNITGTGEKYDLPYTDANGNTRYRGAHGKDMFAIEDLNLINEYVWADSTATIGGVEENGVIDSNGDTGYTNSVTTKNSTTAYVYNRYDAMQGKWGLTLDKNVKSVTWSGVWKSLYYGTEDLNTTILNLTDTPYLYYSTEALDTTQMAISFLIGTPVQSELKSTTGETFSHTYVKEKQYDKDGKVVETGGAIEYVYRWYTITDNALRPGISAESMNYSMVPNVHISDIVMQDNHADRNNSVGSTLAYIAEGYAGTNWDGTKYQVPADPNRLNPIALAGDQGDSLFVSGSITGCIDFTQVLPLLMSTYTTNPDGSTNFAGNGRQAVRYRIAQVRVDTKTAEGAEDSAARINYMYFGPALSTVYTPQSTLGNEVNGANWQYAQNGTNIADSDPNNVALNLHNIKNNGGNDGSYTNGWENGQAVSITNTPNDPQKITIDTYGMGDGVIKDITGDFKTSVSYATSLCEDFEDAKIWEYTTAEGKKVKLEAKRNGNDGNYYINVTIPIRKWINVIDDSRKISFTLNMERYASDVKHENGTVLSHQLTANGDPILPNFCLWGNDDGALGAGHSTSGTRYHNEDMLCVFGENGYYQIDNFDYRTDLIDQAIGKSVMFNDQLVETLYSHPLADQSSNAVVNNAFNVYSDKNGVTYYECGGVFYTREQIVDQNGYAKYVDATNDDKFVYFYHPDTKHMLDGDGKTETEIVLGQLTPMYLFTVANVTAADLEMVYESNESWIDLLRSPYMLRDNRVLKAANTTAKIDDDMAGYVFVTALRIPVPVGSTVTIQNMKGEGNSAGLNTYSTEGHVVAAYDGGSGAQPEMGVAATDTLIEKTASYADEQYTINDSTNVAYGTQSNHAVAYGPYINGSSYTIYDLLDTEALNNQISADQGAKTQTLYGVPYEVKAGTGGALPVYSHPYGNRTGAVGGKYNFNGKFGGITREVENYIYANLAVGDDFVVYGTVELTDTATNYTKSAELWGMVGVYTNQGNHEVGWVRLANKYRVSGEEDWNVTQLNYKHQLAFQEKYTSIAAGANSTYDCWSSHLYLLELLKNKWMFSNFDDSNTVVGQLYSTGGNGYPLPMYANEPEVESGFASGYNSTQSLGDVTLKANNTTDMELVFSAQNSYSGWGSTIGISRTFKTPIVLTNNAAGGEKTWPVLYYDYESTYDYAQIALTMRVNGVLKLYFLNSAGQLTETQSNLAYGANYGYFSFKEIMRNAEYTADEEITGKPVIEILAVNLSYSNEADLTNGKQYIRRLEIWQDQTPFLDMIVDTEGKQNSVTSSLTATMADGFNIINDAFFNTHDEAADGAAPYKKNNSNKGWMGTVRLDSNYDGAQESFMSYDASTVDGVYEYRTALGHLRVWVPAHKTADIIFTSDRSFNTKNYKYLYYSYSMRDIETGISAESTAADGNGSGISVAIKSLQHESKSALLEQYGTWVYYDENTPYQDVHGKDNRTYCTTMSAAVDLSSFNNLESINQLVFYLNNEESSTAEFYINYVYLSNVKPDETISKLMEEEQIQYYYLMDNTGDRYSARFPTIDNPTGQVTGTNCDNDRVNPIKVVRGERLSTGTYFNGERLYGYGGDEKTERKYDEGEGSPGYYEKTYGNDATPNKAENGSMKNIMFYMGVSSDLNDINDYYEYKDRGRIVTVKNPDGTLSTYTQEPDGVANVYDMLWSYGRWFTSDGGDAGLNIMYIGDPALNQGDTGSYTENQISGSLVRRYATENYVLLRSGITPKTYTTYFDAAGGEFLYDSSSDEINNLQKVTENSYYATDDVVMGYYTQPNLLSAMKGEVGADYNTFLKKPGFTFSHWEHYTVYGERDDLFNADDKGNPTYTDPVTGEGNGARFMSYIKKKDASAEYFRAVWVKDTVNYPDELTFTATFTAADGETTWSKLDVGDPVPEDDVNGRFILTLPSCTVTDGKIRTPIYGWQDKSDTSENPKIYSPGDKIYLLKDTTFIPVTDPSVGNTFTITLENAKLYVRTNNGLLNAVEKHGATLSEDGTTYKYTNVPENYSLVAVPTGVKDNHGWLEVVRTDGSKDYIVEGVTTILNGNEASYAFTAHEDINISYSSIEVMKPLPFYQNQDNTYVTISPSVLSTNDPHNVYFTSQFQAGTGCTAVAYGTLLTKDTYYDNYTDVDGKLRLAAISQEIVNKKSYQAVDSKGVRVVSATTVSSNNEYTLRVSHTKDYETMYYARAYMVYTDSAGNYKVAYSDVVACSLAEAAISA